MLENFTNPQSGFAIDVSLEDLRNRLVVEGRTEDADTVRCAIVHIESGRGPWGYYKIARPEEGYRKRGSFTEEEKKILRPMAETLAMMDGNAFFGNEGGEGEEWYEMYLPEADAIFQANGGLKGWAGEASFAKEQE